MIAIFAPVLKRPRRLAALFFFLCAAGCAAPPSPQTLPHTKEESAFIAPDATLEMSDGTLIPLRFYRATPPLRGTILALHGFNDSRDGWEILAPALTRHGFTIAAPDIRGFGGVQPPVRWASSTRRLINDVQEELLWLHRHDPEHPLYLMGESMGGALALLSAENTSLVSGTILLSPAIMKLPFPLGNILTFWNILTPDMVLTESNMPGHRISTANYRALRRLYFDPLTRHDATVHALYGLTTLMTEASGAAPHASLPLLVIWGARDQFVPPRTYNNLRKNLPQDTRFDLLDTGYHLLSRDQNRVSADIISWLLTPDKFLPSGGDFAAVSWDNTPHNPF
ncbi:alpha/beta fold hydrolase [Acetobacteraceae bacterium ESL0709]|nr:alpha/beta fold hydrolase [Acetobacteraceae bacterium ESL0697]MDF7677650.1 alpha/beta fold hydrolase [Acetobacteraceae bacterium ESL0709]